MPPKEVYRHKREHPCPNCGHITTASGSTDGTMLPRPKGGDWSICIKCGSIGVYTGKAGETRKATKEELLEAQRTPSVQDALRRWAWMMVETGQHGERRH